MKNRTFFLSSILMGVIAIGFHSVARDHILRGQLLKSKRIDAAFIQNMNYLSDLEANRLSGSGHILNTVGLIFTFSCLALLIRAFVRREPGWYSIPIMLLLLDIYLQVLL